MEPFDYHQSTKHSYFSIRTHPNRLDWDNQPSQFKSYPQHFKKIQLDYSNPNHRLLILSAGITAKKSYPGVEYYLRINPSAGALFPCEIYFQARNLDGFENGIYHFEIESNSVTLLQTISSDGIESYLGLEKQQEGFIFLFSSIYYRSSWKYKNRALRYCLLDTGHLLGCVEASCYLQDRAYQIQYNFDKKRLNSIFGFKKQEFFTAAIIIGNLTEEKSEPLSMQLDFVDGTNTFESNELIEFAYAQTLEQISCDKSYIMPHFSYNKTALEDTMVKRRSAREFFKRAISKVEFEAIMENLNAPIISDCDEEVSIYCVINRVQGMQLGLYLDKQYLKEGDFQSKAGYLCLEQELGHFSAVTFFLTSNARNYQALYQKAGIIGHRLYLAANYLGIGCSGIGAYYDDEVNEFLENNHKVLYALAIGN